MGWQSTIHMGKQVHTLCKEIMAPPGGMLVGVIPRTAFVFQVLFNNMTSVEKKYYGESKISLGIAGDKTYFCKPTDISDGGVAQAVLNRGAGKQLQDINAIAFWHYDGTQKPTSGQVCVLVVYALDA